MNVAAALVFGLVAGLRTVTAEAVYFGLRGGVLGVIFPIAAIGEYIADVYPKTPPRTTPGPVFIRCASGAFMGWTVARVPGVIAGIFGALIGTFGGYRLRLWLIARVGAIPAAIVEDVLAIALAFAALAAVRTPA
jgi:uncharacterized membrane protein